MSNLIGQRLGNYEILGLLGKGGMATVYRARQTNIAREVAVKVIKSDLADSEEFMRRFAREAQTIAALSHPHILKLFDYGEQNELIYLVMEIMMGGSLDSLIRQGPMTPETIIRVLDQISSALDYAHQRSIIHRDLKPQNVLLDDSGNAYLTDFGIARMVQNEEKLTATGSVMGTPAYMSPEQGQGRPIDARSDIYTLGVVLYEMVLNRLPFEADSSAALIFQHVYERPRPPKEVRPDLPDPVVRVLERALAKNPEDRYPTAGDLAKDFAAAVRNPGSATLPSDEVVGGTIVGGPMELMPDSGSRGSSGATGPVTAGTRPRQNVSQGASIPAPISQAGNSGANPPITPARRFPLTIMIGAGAGVVLLLLAGILFVTSNNNNNSNATGTAAETMTEGARAAVIKVSDTSTPTLTNTATLANTATNSPTRTATSSGTSAPISTAVPATLPPTSTVVPPSATLVPSTAVPTFTPRPTLTFTSIPPSATAKPPTATSSATSVPPTIKPLEATVAPNPATTAPDTSPTVAANKDWQPQFQKFGDMDMALVPAGCFVMGTLNALNLKPSEHPTTPICFAKPFWIGKTDVTQVQDKKNNSFFRGDNHPVEFITWPAAAAFCTQLGARLPTEAEWEYAARGPDNLLYPWGNDWDPSKAVSSYGTRADSTSDVGSIPKSTSWVGALDMSGNVRQWTSTIFKNYPYDSKDGRENNADTSSPRTVRGGSYYDDQPEFLRATSRLGLDPTKGYPQTGFRCVRDN